jgi:hypothetical protein
MALSADGRAFEEGAGEAQDARSAAAREVFGVCGAACLLRRELFERLGGYDERYFAFYEDVDLNVRARIAGRRFAYVPEAVVHHAVFERSARDYVAERLRLRYFPAMAARIPELRGTFFTRRDFLPPRSAAFDAALAGVVLAGLTRRPWPLALAAPYARMARRRGRAWRVDAVADAVGVAALVAGSVANRAPVL